MIKSKIIRKSKRITNPSGEWIKMNLSFKFLIQLQEYNKSLNSFLGFLCEDENTHILTNLSKKDKNFCHVDLWAIKTRIDTLCDFGLKGKDRNWEIASNGDFFKPEKIKSEVNL
jgi:hypothetical protein